MDYDTAQSLSDIYGQQHVLADRAIQLLDRQIRASALGYAAGKTSLMSREDIRLTWQRMADLLADLQLMRQLLIQFDVQLVDELKAEANRH
jgi:hypothetical protein